MRYRAPVLHKIASVRSTYRTPDWNSGDLFGDRTGRGVVDVKKGPPVSEAVRLKLRAANNKRTIFLAYFSIAKMANT
jgi:hypothetical protein